MSNPAAATVEFDHQYNEMCPECAKAGNPDIPVGFSLAEGISCATGAHKFDRAPGEVQTPQTPSAGVPGGQPAAAVTISGLAPLVEKVQSPADGPTPAMRADFSHQDLQEAMREAARKGTAMAPVPAFQPGPILEKIAAEAAEKGRLPSNGKAVQVLDATPASGGDAVVTIRIQEWALSAALAEAGNQGQSLTQYLQDWVSRKFEDEWAGTYR